MALIRFSGRARRTVRALLPILFIIVSGGHVVAQVSPVATGSGGAAMAAVQVGLVVGRSMVIDVGAPISRVSLTSADVADAMVTSSSQLLLNGKLPGTISMFVWERSGALRLYEVVVHRDLDNLSQQLKQLFPGEAVTVHANGKDVVLSGHVTNKAVAEQVVNVAAGYAAKESIISLLAVQQAPRIAQVLLRVRFAEVSRSAMTELGVSFFTSPTGINNTIGRLTTQQFDAPRFEELKWTKESGDFGSDVTSAEGKLTFGDFLNLFLLSQKFDLGMMIRALSNRGLFQTLAEPNLVAESGKEASFLAGGEFPIPVAQGGANAGAITVQYKEFGVRLNFTPTVNGDRVHLKVRPEVSTLDFGNGVLLQGFRIPALSTRRTETELELRDGQTFAIAGLIDSSMSSTLQKIPGIGDIPILGRLFQSKAARKDRTELVVMITPEILREGSAGVTNSLPRLGEPFMETLPQNRSLPAPAPAFSAPAPSGAVAPEAPPVAQVPAARPDATPVPAPPVPVANMTREAKPSDDERKALERQARADADARKVAEKAAAKQAEADRRQAAEEQKRAKAAAEEQAKKDAVAAKAAAEETKRAAEAAKRAAEEAKRQEEAERKRQKAIADAEARLRAAQAAYDQERAASARP